VSSVAGSFCSAKWAARRRLAGGARNADHRVILARLGEEEHGGRIHDGHSGWLRKLLEHASPDLLRAMVQEFAEALMVAEEDALCGAPYDERSPEGINTRNATASGRGRRVGTTSSRSRSSGTAATSPSGLRGLVPEGSSTVRPDKRDTSGESATQRRQPRPGWRSTGSQRSSYGSSALG
jgi:hypothetical protein